MTSARKDTEMPETPYSYFVSYAHAQGFGNTEVKTSLPVTTWAAVQVLQKAAANANTGPVVVMNYVLLSGPSEEPTSH